MMEPHTTIVAAATPNGQSALAVIRLSGPLCQHIYTRALGQSSMPPRRAILTHYCSLDDAVLDQLLALYFPAPHSFTGEDVLELSCHGNSYIVRKIIDDLCQRGCQLAGPGEFSRRAFLNGKLDLSQAEAIQQLIHARSEQALTAAQRQLSGSVGNAVRSMVHQLLKISAAIEAYIDFPEEDLPPEDAEGPLRDLAELSNHMERMMATRAYSALLHEGARCVILGEPNVGKSSLLNALTGEDRAIVSNQPGTTRDYLEERIQIGPFLIRVIDTAGLHHADSDIEQQGIQRTLAQVEQADVLLVVLDATRPCPTLPEALHPVIAAPHSLILHNKIDLADTAHLDSFCPSQPHLKISAVTQDGLPQLRDAIVNLLKSDVIVPDADVVMVSARHATALQTAREAIQCARDKLFQGIDGELVSVDLREAVMAMGQIVGNIDNEQMLDQLFANFCIGK